MGWRAAAALAVGSPGAVDAKSVWAGLVAYFGYFTVLTNIFVAMVAIAPSIAVRVPAGRWLARKTVAGCATTAIVLVGIVYHFLLRHVWAPTGLQWLADIVLHYGVPAASLGYWVVFQQGGRLPAGASAQSRKAASLPRLCPACSRGTCGSG